MLSKLSTHKKIVGAKQVKRALNSSLVDVVFIADDAEKKVVEEIEELSNTKQIQIIRFNTMENLGKACGIDINAAAAALLK
ncbi:50S ribosomal protein L7ae-like protein [Tissierella creatinini]|nr:50S ribosomal protein L7ae-like protein [Tissierella creatinini]TJX61043.1 50S ribosomal protein L7ae-like protein [Soehngenia saccharolytica]